MEIIVVLVGLCLTFSPALLFANYIINKPMKKTDFDSHLELVKFNKGTFGVVIAYLERFLFGLMITTMGILLSEYFVNKLAVEILIVTIVLYFIVFYFNEKNKKM